MVRQLKRTGGGKTWLGGGWQGQQHLAVQEATDQKSAHTGSFLTPRPNLLPPHEKKERDIERLGGWDVDKHGVLVGHQGVHDHSPKLEDLPKHVAGAATETAPVGEHHEWQVLTPVEVVDGLGRLVCRVRGMGLNGGTLCMSLRSCTTISFQGFFGVTCSCKKNLVR